MLINIYHDYTKDLSWFTTKLYPSNDLKKKEGAGVDEEERRGLEGGREDWGWRIVSKRKVNKGSGQN